MRRSQAAGLWIAVAAILVQAPRLVLVLLAADRQAVSAVWEETLLIVAGIGTALVLTGGNLYLAHTVATVRRWRGWLGVVWVSVLAASGGLVVPKIAAGLSGRGLPEVLGSAELQWGWAVLAAVAHELTAAGCMLASAARAGERATRSGSAAALGRLEERQAAAESAGERLAQPVTCREGCGKSFKSVLAEMGHLRHCPVRLRRQAELPSAEQ